MSPFIIMSYGIRFKYSLLEIHLEFSRYFLILRISSPTNIEVWPQSIHPIIKLPLLCRLSSLNIKIDRQRKCSTLLFCYIL